MKSIALIFILTTLSVSAFLMHGCGRANTNTSQSKKSELDRTQGSPVKLYPIVFEGNRYVVKADFGLPAQIPLMVHGNAGLYLMITHEIAEQLNHGAPIEKLRDYGYSDKGFGTMHLRSFRIGDRTFSNLKHVPVFDWPGDVGKSAQGMLGVEFLKSESCIIDFNNEQMIIGAPLTGGSDTSLENMGYTPIEFFIENGRAYMQVFFDALNKELPITVGTVADDYVLDAPVFINTIALEEMDEKEHSPNRTTPGVFTNAKPITYHIAGRAFEVPAHGAELYSLAEYANILQSELESFGIFGRDWMKEHHAVIDYANQILYFK